MAKPVVSAPVQGAVQRRFVTFRADGQLYAVPAEDVSEVIGMLPVARVPQSPKCLLGLANLRGSVLPLISLRLLLGREGGGVAAHPRAVVLQGATPLALAVDAVEAIVAVGPDQVETGQAELAAEPGELLCGAFRVQAGQEYAKILDVPGLLQTAFSQQKRPSRGMQPAGQPLAVHDAAKAEGDRQVLVTFDVAGQEYALALEDVQEILPFPDALATAPRAEAVLLGVASYRDSLLPLLSLRGLLGVPMTGGAEADGKVIVTRAGGALAGLVADRMRAVIRADAALIDPAPAMLAARSGGEARIKAIFRGEGGRRLVSILAPEQLFREDVMRRLGTSSPVAAPRPEQDGPAQGETIPLLVFRLGDEEFGLPISVIDEVARVPETITRVPKTPKFLEGVINLRGEVLPVVDQRKRFDLPAFRGEGRRLVVVRTERHRAGLIVDSVSEVMRPAAGTIGPAPDLTEEMTRLVSGVINLEGRLVLLLDPAELLSRAEHRQLDSFGAGPASQAPA
jgi:purine-binding chemotaxis protein CheW